MGEQLLVAGATPRNRDIPSEQIATDGDNAIAMTEGYAPFPSKNSDPCYQTYNQDSADQCVQWRSMLAAERAAQSSHLANDIAYWSNGISAAGALLTLVSIGLLIWTLILSKRQLNIVEIDRAEAREESARLARDTASALAQTTRAAEAAIQLAATAHATLEGAKATDRAWLFPGDPSHVRYLNSDLHTSEGLQHMVDSLGFYIPWFNHGCTPAIGVQLYISILVWYDQDVEPQFPPVDRPKGLGTIAPNGPPAITARKFITDKENNDFRNRTCSIKLKSIAFYSDIFTQAPRETVVEYIFRYEGVDDVGGDILRTNLVGASCI